MRHASKKAIIDLRRLCNCARFGFVDPCFREHR